MVRPSGSGGSLPGLSSVDRPPTLVAPMAKEFFQKYQIFPQNILCLASGRLQAEDLKPNTEYLDLKKIHLPLP